MKTHAFRLCRGQDLRKEIELFATNKEITAGLILTCVGNLEKVTIRMSDGKTIKDFTGSFEIVSLVGTLEKNNSHLHISFSDLEGKVFGGHLKIGSIVGTTAEIVMGELEDSTFSRKLDPQTGYDELFVE